MPRKIIIDTDPGRDDAVAILLALASPEFDIEALVAVAGNVPLALTQVNARRLVELAGRPEVPVYAGSVRPMLRPLVTAEHVHGRTGLDGITLPAPRVRLQPQHGVDFLIERLRGAPPGAITLCALGPLTNVAMALVKAPDIAPRIAEIVMMGGAYFEGGNITPTAEFNVFVDPHAADVVLRSGIPVTMIPLDLTHGVVTTPERMARLRGLGNRCGTTLADLLSFSEDFDKGKYRWDGAPLHDPNVIAYLLRPELYEGRRINVTVETASELTLGMTVADYWGVTNRPANVNFLRRAEAEGVYALIFERIKALP
jgi:purine nucleosidase